MREIDDQSNVLFFKAFALIMLKLKDVPLNIYVLR